MADVQDASGRLTGLLRRSMDRVSGAALKFVPFDKGNEDADAALTKKEHRRAQVRKAQIEHRQRKENHIKTLEQEIASLRSLIEDVENQSRLVQIENESIRCALASAQPTHLDSLVPLDSIGEPEVALDSKNPGSSTFTQPNSQDFVPPPTSQHYQFDTMASVAFDESMNVSRLQLKQGEAFVLDQKTMIFPPQMGALADLTVSKDNAEVLAPQNLFIDTIAEDPIRNEFEEQQLISQRTYAVHKDPEFALTAINFILALEHPCRTHFLPRDTGSQSDLPKLPEHLPSGHEMMASTYLYNHAPLPIFKSMHAEFKASSSRQVSPSSATNLTPWKVPIPSPTDELMKLYAMSTSLPKEDWEITPVQAWFSLVERTGAAWCTGVEGQRNLEVLKKNLGGLVQCFGFGAVLTERLFWDEIEKVIAECGL